MDDSTVQRLVSELLIALGEHVGNGSLTLHFGDNRLQQTEVKKFRKYKTAAPALRAAV